MVTTKIGIQPSILFTMSNLDLCMALALFILWFLTVCDNAGKAAACKCAAWILIFIIITSSIIIITIIVSDDS